MRHLLILHWVGKPANLAADASLIPNINKSILLKLRTYNLWLSYWNRANRKQAYLNYPTQTNTHTDIWEIAWWFDHPDQLHNNAMRSRTKLPHQITFKCIVLAGQKKLIQYPKHNNNRLHWWTGVQWRSQITRNLSPLLLRLILCGICSSYDSFVEIRFGMMLGSARKSLNFLLHCIFISVSIGSISAHFDNDPTEARENTELRWIWYRWSYSLKALQGFN
jgi:hypothetical protein